jgi:hypothetical protein
MRTIDDWAWEEYARGATPYEYAQGIIAGEIRMYEQVKRSRAKHPEAYPMYPAEPDSITLTSRIVQALMAAGWSPPNVNPSDFTTDPDEVPWT